MKQIFLTLIAASIISCTTPTKNQNTIETEKEPVNNFLLNTHWLCDLADGDLIFTPLDTTGYFQYGFHIQFTDSINYIHYYTAPCGNDCFTSIYGKYEFLSDSTILITRDSITYDGDCYQFTEYPNIKNEYNIHTGEGGKLLLKKE